MGTAARMSAPTQIPTFVNAIRAAEKLYQEQVSRSKLALVWREEAYFAHQQVERSGQGDFSLMNCTPNSIAESIVQAAQFGLSLNPRKGYAYLVPRFNRKRRVVECHLEIGYRGYIKIAAQAGVIKRADANIIYSKDTFTYRGASERVTHVITSLSTDPTVRGQMAGGYCEAVLTDDTICTVTMSPEELLAIEQAALDNAYGNTPWAGPFKDEMRKKTLIRRAWKTWESLVEAVGGNVELVNAVSRHIEREDAGFDGDGSMSVSATY